MYHLSEAYLMATNICLLAGYLGALVFSAATVAPLAARVLPEAAAALLMRRFWERHHLFASLGGAAFALAWGVASTISAVPIIYSSLLVALAAGMTLSFFMALQLIPSINEARDRGNEARFKRLHRTDIILIALGVAFGIAMLIALIYVLPGQFTFWPTEVGR